jgi:putative DNA primase/helicase
MEDAVALAYRYKDRGFSPIPVPLGTKSPKITGWQNLIIERDQLSRFFTERLSNIGILLGDASGGLVDIDLDCEEALRLADFFLPKTGMVFGRMTKPASHGIYRTPNPGSRHAFNDPDGKSLVEVRANGCMTIFPGSIHPRGEEIRFDCDDEPAQVEFDQLVSDASHLAAASMLLPHWHQGQRHRLALSLSGTLLGGGIDPAVVHRLIYAIVAVSRDEEDKDRFACFDDTLNKLERREPVSGRTDLTAIVGEEVCRRLCEWFGLSRKAVSSAQVPSSTNARVAIAYGGAAPYSDTANAERFVAIYGDKACYLANEKRWLVWRDWNWTPDLGNARVQSLAIAAMRSMAREAAETKDKEFQRFAMQSLDASRLKNLLYLAQGMRSADHEAFDADPWKINCRSGIIDLRSGRLEDHDPAKRMRKLASVEFDATAECPIFLGFLDRIFAGDRELIGFIQRAVGYSLTGRTDEQCLFVLVGNGANGKSTLIRVLHELLGDYAQQTPTNSLMSMKAEGVGNDIARLEGARFVAASEAEAGQKLAEAKIKAITGGDRLTARFLYGEFFEFSPQFKLWLATNRLPEVRGTDNGIWRRLCVIPFDVTIPEAERDGSLLDKLRAELPGILNWAIAGCFEWQKTGLLPPESVTNAGKAYRADMDQVMQFVEDRCVLERGVEATTASLFDAYGQWCGANGERALTKREFGLRLKNLGLEEARTGKARKRRGVRLKDEAEMLALNDQAERPAVGIAAE